MKGPNGQKWTPHPVLSPDEAVVINRMRREPYLIVLFEGSRKEPYDLLSNLKLGPDQTEARAELCLKLEMIAMQLRRRWAREKAEKEEEEPSQQKEDQE